MDTEYTWKDVKSLWSYLAKKLIKPYVRLPSKSKVSSLEPETQTIVESFMKNYLLSTKGVLDLPVETLLEKLGKSDLKTFCFEENCEFTKKLILLNYKITLVSPESYYDCGEISCPHDGCNEKLRFQQVQWDYPRLVLGITEKNEVVIPLLYKCSNHGSFSTIDSDFISTLPSYVQKKYHFNANKAIVFNSSCFWSLLVPDST